MIVIVPKGPEARTKAVERLVRVLGALSADKSWYVTIAEKKPRRSDAQNALLWSIYTDIIRRGAESMRGYTKEELHEFFLGNHFGWVIKEVFGKRKHVPARRSSGLNKQEFSDFIESIVIFMANQGVALEMPGEAV